MYCDLRNRAPTVEILPDLRRRVTRVYDVLNEVPKNPSTLFAAQWEIPWGTADYQWGSALLIKQDMEGQTEEAKAAKVPARGTRVYEEISPTGETQVGQAEVDVGQDGLQVIVENFLQFSVAVSGVTPIYKTVGVAGISSPFAAVLKSEERTDDGTLQRIKRTYTAEGLISTDTQTKYNGALLLQTLTSVGTVPSTPSGYTVVDQKVNYVNGLPVYTYTYAKGNGLISTMVEYRLSPNQGSTGVTVTTIKYLSAPGASNPITPPGGSEEISLTYDESDGYMLWTGIYASGTGTIQTTTEIRNDGKLYLTTILAINAAPSTPSAQIGGTVTLIKTDVRNGTRFEDGTVMYEYVWAEGNGEISIDIDYLESIDQGTNGVTRTTIKWLVAPGATVQPTSLSGSVNIKSSYEDVEGYRIWTTVWGKGAGLVLDEYEISKTGALVLYHRIGLGSAPSTPSAKLSGTVTLIANALRNAEGYQMYDYRWAEGNGTDRTSIEGEPDGALVYDVVTFQASQPTTPPAYPGSGTAYCIKFDWESLAGYYVNRGIWKKPPATRTYPKQVAFEMPGQIEATSPNPGFYFVPPVRRELLATVTVSYGTSTTSTTPFSVTAWASLNYSYVVASNGQVVTGQKGLTGYLSGATSASGSGSYNGVNTSSWTETIAASTPSAPPSGATTIGLDNEPYLTDYTGVAVYKTTATTYSF